MYEKKKGDGVIDRLTKEQLNQMVEKTNNLFEIFAFLGINKTSIQIKKLYNKLVSEGFNLIDLKDKNSQKRSMSGNNKKTIIEFLQLKKVLNWNGSSGIKRRMIVEGFLTENCYLCPVKTEWNGLPINLQIDHIDGNSLNNQLNNLRLLCPNCHSQTETYCRRNKIPKSCRSCLLIKDIGHTGVCLECFNQELDSYIIDKFGSKQKLIDEVVFYGYNQISKKYKIGYKTLRKILNGMLDDKTLQSLRHHKRAKWYEISKQDKLQFTVDFLKQKGTSFEEICSILNIKNNEYPTVLNIDNLKKFPTLNNYSDDYLKFLYNKHKNYRFLGNLLGFTDNAIKRKLIQLNVPLFRLKSPHIANKICQYCNLQIPMGKAYSSKKYCDEICSLKSQQKVYEKYKDQVYDLHCKGFSNEKISKELNISKTSVLNYIRKTKSLL